MSMALWFEEQGVKVAETYVSDGVMSICVQLEEKRLLPPGGGKLGFLDGKNGSQVVPILDKVIASLSDEGIDHQDLFSASEGNAKTCLSLLREQALKHPNAKVVAWR